LGLAKTFSIVPKLNTLRPTVELHRATTRDPSLKTLHHFRMMTSLLPKLPHSGPLHVVGALV
jgi:hypothetical protein